jgi:hypothetical protein
VAFGEERQDRLPDPGIDDALVQEDERRSLAGLVVPEVGHCG